MVYFKVGLLARYWPLGTEENQIHLSIASDSAEIHTL